MFPSNKYLSILRECGYESDESQQHALILLDKLQSGLVHRLSRHPDKWWQKLFPLTNSLRPMRGIYLSGGVGRGKTFLMDIFYQCLPIESKRRVHFHQFMNEVHQSLGQLKNVKNPLQQVASEISKNSRVLCLDEFLIIDIADAMIMSGLLEALFEQDVILVTTSNNLPQNLYHDGLQRARFLPAIDLIIEHCEIINLGDGHDYRLQSLQQTDLYMVPHSPIVLDGINCYLAEHVTPYQSEAKAISINDRNLQFQYCAEDTIWFNFHELCKTNRSQRDYLELARMFNTLILTNIEVMSGQSDDIARRFILLIDVLYDHHVILICSASASPRELYQGKRLAFEFERTISRLIEMQSQQYLAQAHTTQ